MRYSIESREYIEYMLKALDSYPLQKNHGKKHGQKSEQKPEQ